jgi:hypothetical protein
MIATKPIKLSKRQKQLMAMLDGLPRWPALKKAVKTALQP